jgi:hypothetical protein
MIDRLRNLSGEQKVIAAVVAFIYLLSLAVTYLEMQNML